jgi:adenylate kinase family enzyme
MSNVLLETLRKLRSKADSLRKYVGSDLAAFKPNNRLTFLRTPESLQIADDVNVTTTCSCLMALALTGQADGVYGKGKGKKSVSGAFKELVAAPWMSSGLTENNAFTTALVIRTLGFLRKEGFVSAATVIQPNLKRWELHLGIKPNKLEELLDSLERSDTPTTKFIWQSLSDAAQAAIKNRQRESATETQRQKLLRTVSLELQRTIEGSSIYREENFPSASNGFKGELERANTMYKKAAANRLLVAESFPTVFELKQLSITQIADAMSNDIENFTINQYPPTAAVVYWFVDGVTRAEIDVPPKNWESLCTWATNEFNQQRSLVVAQHDAMMDPVAMAMAACLCARLQSHAGKLTFQNRLLETLPSRIELEHSICKLFEHQTNGIWPKYFPLFHYQDAGSNFCFAFELLEAILVEFGDAASPLFDREAIVKKLGAAVDWCEKNLLRPKGLNRTFVGWNSGGSLDTLRKGHPESWATAVVHMFLWELSEKLSEEIQRRLLERYQAHKGKDLRGFDALVDIEILYQKKPYSLQETLRKKVLSRLPNGESAGTSLRRKPIDTPHSALLFGPPGTSKTELAEAVANSLDWPLIQIDPSDFLRENLDQIYAETGKIFDDLMDLSGVVILFDEMDALVQTRDKAAKLDTAGQFLTTFMLPKLTKLHDCARSVFFMATNFQDRFDQAIKRRGRFDLLLCMGPPTLEAKTDAFHKFIGKKKKATEQTKNAARLFLDHAKRERRIEAQLAFYTFSEFKDLVKRLGDNIGAVEQKLEKIQQHEFVRLIDEDSQFATLRLKEVQGPPGWSPVGKSLKEIKELNIDRAEFDKENKPPLTQITRYIADLRESRIPVS